MQEPNFEWTLPYDADCELCLKLATVLRQWDRQEKIHLTPLQLFATEQGNLSLEDLQKDLHLISESGQIFRGSEAVTKILEILPEMKPFLWLLESRVAKKGSGVVYKFLNRFRYGRKKRCKKCNRRQ